MKKAALGLVGLFVVSACGRTAERAPVAAQERQHSAATNPPAVAAPLTRALAEPAADADAAADRRTIAELEKAYGLYREFIERAGDDEDYADAVARSKERMADIRDTLRFFYEGLDERTRTK